MAEPMVRKFKVHKRAYDIAFNGFGGTAITLTTRDKNALAKTIECQPSPEFINAYCSILGAYVERNRIVTGSTAKAIQKRIVAVAECASALQETLTTLSETDLIWLNHLATMRILRGERCTAFNELSESIVYLLPVISEANALLMKEPTGGSMPNYADQPLANEIGQILFEETEQMPTTKQGSVFDTLLKLAFIQAGNKKPRTNVRDLLRSALKAIRTEHPILPCFQTSDDKNGQKKRVGEAMTKGK